MQIPSYLLNEYYDDRYFDVVNAIEEAEHVFFSGSNLLDALSSREAEGRKFGIGETGFGAGRILIALMDYLDRSRIRNLTIRYNSVELHPIKADRMAAILEPFRSQVGSYVDMLVKAYSRIDTAAPGWHQIQFKRSFGVLTLHLWIGEALEMVKALTMPCDAWFLDGHGPKKNPAMWRPELLLAIGDNTVSGGTCATYTVAGAVRRGLGDAGFAIEQRPGFGGKKSVLKGIKR